MKTTNLPVHIWGATAMMLITALIWALPAYAKGDTPNPRQLSERLIRDADQSQCALEEITVIARKRDENLKDVPIAVTSVGERDILNSGIEGMDKVLMTTPGLFGMQSAQSTSSTFNIRGVGAIGLAGWEDATVSAYLDGVPIPMALLDNHILDIERIEVLRGPQGTLYGKTALGGAINLISAAPSDIFEGRVGGTLGNQGTWETEAVLSGPLIPNKLNARLFFRADTCDSTIKQMETGEPIGDVNRFFSRAIFDAFWSDRAKTKLILSYDNLDNENNIFVTMTDKDRSDNPYDDAYEKRTSYSAGLINTFDLPREISLNFVTGFDFSDIDHNTYQPGGTLNIPEIRDNTLQLTQEARFDGEIGDFEWSAGLFGSFFKRDIDHSLTRSDSILGNLYDDNGDQTKTNLAVFGENTYAFTHRWKLTTGMRLSWDEATVDEIAEYIKSFPQTSPAFTHHMKEEKDETNWSGRVILSYLPTQNHTLYGSVARGYKPGGYQMYHNGAISGTNKDTADYDTSTAVTCELGYKGLFFDNRLSVSSALFYIQTTGDQIMGVDPVANVSTFFNIDTQSYGLELEARASVTKEITAGGSIALIAASFTENVQLYPAMPAYGIPATWVKKGDSLPNTPKISGNLFVEYRHGLSFIMQGLQGFIRPDYYWQGKTYYDANHSLESKNRGILGIHMGVQNEWFRLGAYADNLTNEEYFTYALLGIGTPGRAREFGVRLTFYF